MTTKMDQRVPQLLVLSLYDDKDGDCDGCSGRPPAGKSGSQPMDG